MNECHLALKTGNYRDPKKARAPFESFLPQISGILFIVIQEQSIEHYTSIGHITTVEAD